MERWGTIAALLLLMSGCATQVSVTGASRFKDAEPRAAAPMLRFQSNAIAPAEPLVSAVLQVGDIVLTTDPTFTSASIRLMTLAPVSHAAVYVGEGKVAEALGAGVRVRAFEELLDEAAVVLVLRYPGLTEEQAVLVREYAVGKSGTGFSFLGVTLHIPFSVARRLCELPLVSPALRDACIRGMGVLHHVAASEARVFCSQLVLQAYRHAGVHVTDADPRLISPADILHMREGDVSSVKIAKQLHYVGRLKHEWPATTLALRESP
jgi:uncharacterized protein YycO